MTRNGKIARLPRVIREELNQRMDDGETAEKILPWLNRLPEVKSTMAAQFAGAAINKQNLSEWRLGGHQDWLRHRQACEFLGQVRERAEDLDQEAGGEPISDRLASVLASELAAMAQLMMSEAADAGERWKRLQELLAQLSRLRRGDHRAMKLKEQKRAQRREEERAELAEQVEQKKKEEERKAQAPLMAALVADSLKMLKEINDEEREEKVVPKSEASQPAQKPATSQPMPGSVPVVNTGRGESGPVKPSQTEKGMRGEIQE